VCDDVTARLSRDALYTGLQSFAFSHASLVQQLQSVGCDVSQLQHDFTPLLRQAIRGGLIACELDESCRILSLMAINTDVLQTPDLHVYLIQPLAGAVTNAFQLYATLRVEQRLPPNTVAEANPNVNAIPMSNSMPTPMYMPTYSSTALPSAAAADPPPDCHTTPLGSGSPPTYAVMSPSLTLPDHDHDTCTPNTDCHTHTQHEKQAIPCSVELAQLPGPPPPPPYSPHDDHANDMALALQHASAPSQHHHLQPIIDMMQRECAQYVKSWLDREVRMVSANPNFRVIQPPTLAFLRMHAHRLWEKACDINGNHQLEP